MKYVYSIDEIKEIYSMLDNNSIYNDILIFQIFTGLRIGETLALCWKDIDLINTSISINKTVTKINKVQIVSSPKTRYSYRKIFITPSILKILNKQDKRNNLVFSTKEGNYINRSQVRLYLKSVLKNTIFHNLTTHDLRHLHASILLHNGVSLKTISSHLGHSSIRITADTYIKVFDDDYKKLSYDINDFFEKANDVE